MRSSLHGAGILTVSSACSCKISCREAIQADSRMNSGKFFLDRWTIFFSFFVTGLNIYYSTVIKAAVYYFWSVAVQKDRRLKRTDKALITLKPWRFSARSKRYQYICHAKSASKTNLLYAFYSLQIVPFFMRFALCHERKISLPLD